MTLGLETRRLPLRCPNETDLPLLVNLAGQGEIADAMISAPHRTHRSSTTLNPFIGCYNPPIL